MEESTLKKKPWRLELAVFVLLTAIVFAAFGTGILNRGQTWDSLHLTRMFMQDDKVSFTAEADGYGCKSTGPYLTLPAGEYRFRWRALTDGESNYMFIASANGVEISPPVLLISSEDWDGEAQVTLDTAVDGLEIQVYFVSGTYLDILDVRIYTPEYTDNAWLLAFALLGGYLIWLSLRRGWLTPARAGRLVLIGISVLVASAPAFKETLCNAHDTPFHIARLCNLADGLRLGQFPVRCGGFSYNGYGAVTSVFYPDLFLYPFALLMLGGASIQFAMNSLFVATNIVSAITMYACARRILRDEWAGVCASCLYVFGIYRLTDVFTRQAVGEMLAMAFLPLFVLGLYEVVCGDQSRWKTLTFGAFAVFQSHMLSTVMCALLAVGFGLLHIRRIFAEKRVMSIMKAVVSVVLLSLFYFIPFVTYSAQGITAEAIIGDVSAKVIAPAQLLLLGEGNVLPMPRDPQFPGFSLEIGFALLLGSAMTLYAFATRPKKDEPERMAMLCIVGGAVLALMTTDLFPWSHLSVLTRGAMDYLQFPWRLLSIVCVLMTLSAAYGYIRIGEKNKEAATLCALALAAVLAMPMLYAEALNDKFIEFGEGATPYLTYQEYLLPDAKTSMTASRRQPEAPETVTLSNYEKKSLCVDVDVSAQADGEIILPLYAFDGYRVTLDGRAVETHADEVARLCVPVAAGESGHLSVRFVGLPIWHVGDVVSLVTAAAMVFLAWRERRKKGTAC